MDNLVKLVLSMSVSGALLIAVLFLCGPVFRAHFSKAWQYYIWLVVLVRLVVPYSPDLGPVGGLFDRLAVRDAPAQEASVQTVQYAAPAGGTDVQNAAVPAVPASAASAPEIHRTADPWQVAGMVWLAAAAFLLLLKLTAYLRFRRELRKNARRVTDGPAAALLAQTAAEMGIGRTPALFSSGRIGSPMLMGIFRPAVFLTEQALALDAGSLSYVFRHELTHLKRRDLPYKWLAELVVCIHWFNPMVYLMRNRMNALCELSCDEAVAQNLNPDAKREYGGTLLLLSGPAGPRRGVPAATLCEDRAGLKERLSAIVKAGKKSKKTTALSAAAAAVFCLMALCLGSCAVSGGAQGSVPAQTPAPTAEASAEPSPDGGDQVQTDEQAVSTLVKNFGQTLKNVSLTAPAENVKASIKQNYTDFVTPELLETWLNAPEKAPGRAVSSPWPDRIEITGLEPLDEDEYTVNGRIIEVTSVEAGQDGAAAIRPVSLTVRRADGAWRISAVTLGDYVSRGPVVYENTEYGFNFYLPESWKGYSVVEETWQGTVPGGDASNPTETGPKLLLRHPDWTSANPRQDIPIMVFTQEQWSLVEQEALIVSAAPIGPTKLGENADYVFALPPRYNFAFPIGYEEVDQIMQGNPLWPTQPG